MQDSLQGRCSLRVLYYIAPTLFKATWIIGSVILTKGLMEIVVSSMEEMCGVVDGKVAEALMDEIKRFCPAI